ncbi:MAG: prenyltransferase [Acidaminobacter sp.]|uniref:prenyltransferase n=1 Tax=Acidaminobacter sp. TaxID=1872102 RepID=UPI001383CAF5|nr:prenyltransferase [Acidaminobacter sp.]MZQ96655.1 prenyltransferase [Acidaminobacter sp.]
MDCDKKLSSKAGDKTMKYTETIETKERISKKKIVKDLWIALRPLSLTLAVSSTTLGILVAWRSGMLIEDGAALIWARIALVTIGGMLVQACANLVNDFYEGSFKYHRPGERTYKFLKYERTAFDLAVFGFSMLCLAGTGLIGLVLMKLSAPSLIYVGIAGMAGAYAYTGEPFVYKKRGLGAVLSFVLMGPLMVLGAYVAVSGAYSWEPVVLAMPASLMIPLLMMSNEIRDVERDGALGIRTLTVMVGIRAGKGIYLGLLAVAYGMTAGMVVLGRLPAAALAVFVTLPLAVKSYNKVSMPKTSGIRITNLLHIAFNSIMIAVLALAS